MYNSKRKSLSPLGDPIAFKNVPQERKFKPVKKWFGTITTDKGSFLTTYETQQRSEAVAIFKEDARLMNGKLDKHIGVFQ